MKVQVLTGVNCDLKQGLEDVFQYVVVGLDEPSALEMSVQARHLDQPTDSECIEFIAFEPRRQIRPFAWGLAVHGDPNLLAAILTPHLETLLGELRQVLPVHQVLPAQKHRPQLLVPKWIVLQVESVKSTKSVGAPISHVHPHAELATVQIVVLHSGLEENLPQLHGLAIHLQHWGLGVLLHLLANQSQQLRLAKISRMIHLIVHLGNIEEIPASRLPLRLGLPRPIHRRIKFKLQVQPLQPGLSKGDSHPVENQAKHSNKILTELRSRRYIPHTTAVHFSESNPVVALDGVVRGGGGLATTGVEHEAPVVGAADCGFSGDLSHHMVSHHLLLLPRDGRGILGPPWEVPHVLLPQAQHP
mmetsp:Transcript_10433/g.22602  ORF Transcript_10433/g.22602 Transcript_10433/m.22602 type:complete len:359 (+) Transcript_10433:808-1884(+)